MTDKIEKIKEELVYSSPDNPWIKLYYDRVRFPDGHEGRYNRLIEGDGSPGVVIIPIDKQGRVGFVRIYRYPARDWFLELPRGFGKAGVELETNAAIELEEETGYAGKMVALGQLYIDTGITNAIAHYFAAINVQKIKKTRRKGPESTEVIKELVFYPASDVEAMLRDGTVRDSFSAIAVLLARTKNLI